MKHFYIPALLLLSIITFPLFLLAGNQESHSQTAESSLRDDLKSWEFLQDPPSLIAWVKDRTNPSLNRDQLLKSVAALSSTDKGKTSQAIMHITSQGVFARPLLMEKLRAADMKNAKPLALCLNLIGENSEKLDSTVTNYLAAASPDSAFDPIFSFCLATSSDQVARACKANLFYICAQRPAFLAQIRNTLNDSSGENELLALDILANLNHRFEESFLLKKAREKDKPFQPLFLNLLLKNLSKSGLELAFDLMETSAEEPARIIHEALLGQFGELLDADTLKNLSTQKKSTVWKAWWNAQDAGKALAEIAAKTPSSPQSEKIKKWIFSLGDDDFATREDASQNIKSAGQQAIPLLRMNLDSGDLEIRSRTRILLDEMESANSRPISPTVFRILCYKNQPGFLQTAMNFLPLAENEESFFNLVDVLCASYFCTASSTEHIPAFLNDPSPRKRLAAALILQNSPISQHKSMALNLARDSDPWVRNRFCLRLVQANDRTLVTDLIDSLKALGSQDCSATEEFLQEISKLSSPAPLVSAPLPRKELSDFWQKWWTQNNQQTQLVSFGTQAHSNSGNILVSSVANNKVFEITRDGKVLWSISNLAGPMDAQMLPNGNVLIAEHHAQKVTERNMQGEVLWSRNVGANPLAVRRLINGATVIICRSMILEIDRNGNELLKIQRPLSDIMSAERLKDGTYFLATNQMTLMRLDRTGKETSIVRLPLGVASHANEIAQDRSIVMPLTWQNKVQELDATGQVLLDFSVNQPVAAVKLANRNILVATQTVPPRLIEFDRAGKQVSEKPATHPVFRLRGR